MALRERSKWGVNGRRKRVEKKTGQNYFKLINSSDPFVPLIVYDARRDRAFWLDIQEFVGRRPEVVACGKKTIQVRIPLANKLTVKSVDEFRRKSVEVVAELRARTRSADVKKIPR
jgi:hypothetical protein